MFVFVKQSAVIQTPGSSSVCFLWWFWPRCWSLCCCCACGGTTEVCACDLVNISLSLPLISAAYFSSSSRLYLHDNRTKANHKAYSETKKTGRW